MDGVSAAGGIISVISLAIQVASSVKSSYEFLAAVKDAPDDIQDLVAEIDLLRRILELLSRDLETPRQSLPLTLLTGSIQLCQSRLKKLDDLARPLVAGLSTGKQDKTWRSLKAAFRGSKIEQLRGILESAKTTLLLAKLEMSGETISALNSTVATLSLAQTTTISDALQSTREDVSSMMQRLEDQLKDQVEDVVRHLPRATSQDSFLAVPQVLERIISQTVRTAFQESLPEIMTSEIDHEHPRKSRKLIQPQSSSFTRSKRESRPTKSRPTNLNFQDSFASQGTVHLMTYHQNKGCTNSSLRLKRKRITNWYKQYNTFFGVITFRSGFVSNIAMSEGFQSELDDFSYSPRIEFSFSFLPRSWLASSALFLSLSAAKCHGYRLENSLVYYNRVSKDAEIFKACRVGDLLRVQELFQTKKASIYDVDNKGYTLLHTSILSGSVNLCRFLLQNGVKTNVDLGSGTELVSLSLWLLMESYKVMESMDMLRILVENGTDPSSFLRYYLGLHSSSIAANIRYDMQFVEYVTYQDYFFTDINENDNFSNPVSRYVWNHVFKGIWDHNVIQDLGIWKNLGANFDETLCSTMMWISITEEITSHQIKKVLKDLIPLTPDLHGYNKRKSSTLSCAVSCGLYKEWCGALVENGVDLEAFKEEDRRIEALFQAKRKNDIKTVARLEALAPTETIQSSVDFTPARNVGHYRDAGSLKIRRPRVTNEC